LEEQMRQRLEANVADVERDANKMARIANRASPLMETLGGIAIGVVYGGYRGGGGAKPGGLNSFIAALLPGFQARQRPGPRNIAPQAGLVGVRILFELLDSPPTEPSDDDRPDLVLTRARVEFSGVQFAYRAGEPVIRAMSFVAEPGKVTALVGPSGGGKSTVL